jgi:thioredoxin 2
MLRSRESEVVVIVSCPSCEARNRLPAGRVKDRAHCAACKGTLLPAAHPVALASGSDFDELLQSSPLPVLVDFWADWCGPCRAVAPELSKLADARAGELLVAKVDTEELPDVAARYGIRSIPTMILFVGGREAKRISGAMPANAIASALSL